MNEFEIIKTYFTAQTKPRPDVIHGIGDDAAIVSVPIRHELAITTDTLISGVHFPESTLPYDIGYKALAVNLSDLAAMGATPAWVTLALSMPTAEDEWLKAFAKGFFTLANLHGVQLIGGDLAHGPLVVTVQALGFVPTHQGLLRSGAKPGDLIYVTGTLGDAALALAFLQNTVPVDQCFQSSILERLNRPEPRIAVGKALLRHAHAAIDISDGLAADINHILTASQVGAKIYIDRLPLSPALARSLSHEKAVALALSGGDDYELCFTVSAEKCADLEKALTAIPGSSFTYIGEVVASPGLDLCCEDGSKYHGPLNGYQHF